MRKAMIVALLVVVVGGALYFGISRAFRLGGPKPSEELTSIQVERIDETTLKLITLSVGEWKKLGMTRGRWKHPETGEYTILEVRVCPGCGEKIPAPPILGPAAFIGDQALSREEVERATDEWHSEHMVQFDKCARCGANLAPTGI